MKENESFFIRIMSNRDAILLTYCTHMRIYKNRFTNKSVNAEDVDHKHMSVIEDFPFSRTEHAYNVQGSPFQITSSSLFQAKVKTKAKAILI